MAASQLKVIRVIKIIILAASVSMDNGLHPCLSLHPIVITAD